MQECVQTNLARDNVTKLWHQQDARENMLAIHLESAQNTKHFDEKFNVPTQFSTCIAKENMLAIHL